MSVKNKLLEDFLADTRVAGLGDVDGGVGDMTDEELEKRMGELGWVRA